MEGRPLRRGDVRLVGEVLHRPHVLVLGSNVPVAAEGDRGAVGGPLDGAVTQPGQPLQVYVRMASQVGVGGALSSVWVGPAEALQWLSDDEARARSGLPVPSGGWWFGQAGWLSPAGYAQTLLQACGARFIGRSRVARLERRGRLWAALDAQGRCLAEAPVVVVATAHQAAELLRPWTDAPLPLAAVRGQVSLLPAGTPGLTLPRHPVAGADQPTVTAGVARHGDGTGLTWV